AIPLTQNGKLDRRALPDPDFTNTESYTAPRTALEEQLCGIWQEVLGVERVGIHDNFFHIGGDSIVAIRVISKAKQQGLHFSVQDIFTNHAISDLAHKVVHSKDEQEDYQPFSLVTSEQLQRLETAYSNNLSDAYPATFLQKGMLLESTMDAGVYHDVLTYKINAAFNLDKTEEVFQKLIDRHEVLKTCFSEDETEGYLGVVLKKHTTSIQVAETETEQLVIAEIEKAFDFSMPLYRVIISGIREDSFLLTMSFHHAIIDGWSVASLITDFTNNYRITNSLVFAERDVPMYGEYVRNEREVLKNPDYYRFWSDYLDGYDASGFSLVKASMSNELGQHKVRYKISEKESAAIFETARELGVSVDTIFLSLYHNTLCRFEGTNDLAVGLVTNNRLEKQGGDEQLGLFLNTIPFRPRPAKTSDISALISQLAEEKNRVLKYKALPFAFIKSEWLSEVNNYQCAFNYTHFHINEGLDYEQNNMPVSVYEKINIPMLFSVIRQSDSFEIILTAHQGSVDQFLFRQFWSYYQSSLRYLSEHQEFLSSVGLPRLSEDDAVLLRKWNTTAAVIGADQTLHGLFEAQAAKTPDAVALVFKDERLTY
ncbi:MAG TPA: condensation domain-containing protein, partial [Fluviicola sp.]|nr:condensation domain-containing protein [Fluviicola sp.]